jgi:cell division protein FtsW
VILLLAQPDLGMTVIAVISWIGILFVGGLRVFWLGLVGGCGLVGLVVSYLSFPHVRRRIDQFWDPQTQDPSHDLFQIRQSLEAFANGGLFGRGPGEGIVKKRLPDAHADFIFAVAGEEFGLILCLVLLGLFLFIILRSLVRVMHDNSIFAILATSGLLIQFGLQALINMASSLHMIPTKGMTMPFVSYGGSSMLALAIALGMVLALTRKRHGNVDWI